MEALCRRPNQGSSNRLQPRDDDGSGTGRDDRPYSWDRAQWSAATQETRCQKEATVTNPFEDENGVFHVLINEEGQYSLWPSFIDVPDGWRIIHESDNRTACLEFINQHWTDMRPNSLIRAMTESSSSEQQNSIKSNSN